MAIDPNDPTQTTEGTPVGDASSTGGTTGAPLPSQETGTVAGSDPLSPGPINDNGWQPTEGAPSQWAPYGDEQTEAVHNQVTQNLTNPWETLESRNLKQSYTNLQEKDGEALVGTEMEATTVAPTQTAEVVAPVDTSGLDYDVNVIAKDDIIKTFDEINSVAPMEAASMREQMETLVGELENGTIPQWARPAVTKAEQMLASRGISASSVGRDSLFNAIIASAMPIAQQDAQFEQQANQVNYNARVQAIFKDSATENAALQFNATSANQKEQFVNQLTSQVELQNAAREQAVRQFNTGQENSMSQFVGQLDQQRNQFNAQMANVVEQSNVKWRRQINQMNTAGQNAVNQANVQNAFNMSNQALSLMWQEMRDQAAFEFKASQGDKDRANRLEATVMMNEAAAGKEVGTWFKNIVDGMDLFDKVVDAVS